MFFYFASIILLAALDSTVSSYVLSWQGIAKAIHYNETVIQFYLPVLDYSSKLILTLP